MKKLTRFEFALGAVILVHIIVLLKSMFFPYPELFIYPYLTNLGLTPYAQILDQHFPGLMFFPINLANLGFDTPAEFRVIQIAIVAGVHLLLYKIALNLTGSRKTALFGNILFFLFHPFLEGTVLWIDNFLPLLLLPAAYLMLQRNTKSIFISGLFIGLAILMKQVVVPLAILLLLWLWFSERKLTKYFLLGLAIPIALLILYVFSKGILADFVYWTYTFNVTEFAQMGRKFATFRQLLAISVIFAPAILLSLLGFISRKTLLLSTFFWANLLFSYARFDYVHLQPSLPFAILLIIFSFSKLPKTLLNNLLVLYLVPVIWVATHFYLGNVSQEVKFFGSVEYKVADRITELTDRNDPIFMFGTLPHMYQLTETRPSGNMFVFQFPWFMKIAEGRVLAGLISDPPKVIVQQKSASIDDYNLFNYMRKIDNYIMQNYEKIDQVGDIEILIKK